MYSNLEVLAGDVVKIGNLKIKHPKLKDVKKIGESMYSEFIRTFCFQPFDVVESLYKQNIDYEEISNYQLFNMFFPFRYYEDENFRDIFCLFFDIDDVLVPLEEDGVVKYFIITDDKKTVIIEESNFEEIQSVLKMITGFSNRKVEKFKDDLIKEMYIEDLIETEELAKNSKNNNSVITMADLVGAVILDTSYTYETVWDMYLYQFHSCTRMILKREDYRNTMTGIYTGNLDPKKVNMEKIYWLSKN